MIRRPTKRLRIAHASPNKGGPVNAEKESSLYAQQCICRCFEDIDEMTEVYWQPGKAVATEKIGKTGNSSVRMQESDLNTYQEINI